MLGADQFAYATKQKASEQSIIISIWPAHCNCFGREVIAAFAVVYSFATHTSSSLLYTNTKHVAFREISSEAQHR